MAGHSKWANIKRKKEANDSKRSKVFSKLSRLLMVAARKGGGDVDTNPALRLAVEKAKHAKMSKETIEKAIAKGSGEDSSTDFQDVIYEGYGPSGVAYYITALTDNNNRTVAEIKTILSKNNGSLGTPGSTAYVFDLETMSPTFTVELSDNDLEKNEKLIELLEDNDDVQEVFTNIKE